MNGSDQRIYRVEDIEVDTRQGCLRRDGQEFHLRQQTFQVLVYLLQQRERLVTKDELSEHIWQGTAVTDNALVQCITDIRRALGDDPRQPRLLRTIPKAGYRFIGPVEEHWPDDPVRVRTKEVTTVEIGYEAENDRTGEMAPGESNGAGQPVLTVSRAVSSRRLTLGAAGILILVAGVGLAVYLGSRIWPGRRPVANLTLPQTPGKRPVAVMHFENRSETRDLDWLREGLADMLISSLSRSNKLSVLSRQQLSVILDRLGYRSREQIRLEEALEIAGKTQAEVIALGSFAQIGEKVRVDVQLHDARTGQLLTTESLVAVQPKQLFTQVDLLSLKLVSYLGAASSEQEAAQGLAAGITNNLDAYRYYSLALEQTQMFQFSEAITLLEKAIALDPEFAMAHARIGYVYAVKMGLSEKSRPYLTRAFSLSDRLSEKDRLFIAAWLASADRDPARGIEIYRQIIALDPMEIEAYERLSLVLRTLERNEEAVEVQRRGLIIDPERKEIYNALGYTSTDLGRYDDALAAFQRYIQLAPNDPNAYDGLGSFHQWIGQYEQAHAAYQRALGLNPELAVAIIHLGNLYVRRGQYTAALNQFRRHIEVARNDAQRARGYGAQAWIWMRRGNLEEAESAIKQEVRYASAPAWNPVVLALMRGDRAAAESLKKTLFAQEEHDRVQERGFSRFYYYSRGWFALRSGRAAEAVGQLREAVRRRPMDWNIDSYEDCLAQAFLESGQFDEVIAEYERILRINPRYPLAHYHLGQAYERKGDRTQARTAYEHFLQIWSEADPDIPEMIEAKKRLAAWQ